MNILGLSAFYHDSAACLVRNGRIVAAAQEERFTRKKADASFPKQAVDYCLREGGITTGELDIVAYYDKPLLKFDRLLETYAATAPRGFGMFVKGLSLWLGQKLYISREFDEGLGHAYKKRYTYLEHHESHAASAFFPSPFDQAAIITLDGVGEWATGSIGLGQGNTIQVLEELRFPHSLGLLYSAFTYFTGFKVNSGEYKLMGLAPYGKPVYADLIREKLVDLKDDGSFRLDMSYFGYCDSSVMTSRRFDRLFGGPPRQPETPITQREMDLAASIQVVTEEIVLRVANHAHELTKCQNLTLAGGVALNCVANGRLLREGPFDKIWIQPAAGDAGGALGAALFVHHQLLGEPREANGKDTQRGSLLGPEFSDAEIRGYLDDRGAKYEHITDESELAKRIAQLIAEQNVVGHFAGRMEFGPRALGSRSILGDARSTKMQSIMNLKIKFRESFRPFAPAILREHVHEYFAMPPNEDSPYMLLVAPVADDKLIAPPDDAQYEGLDRVKLPRSEVPAITHVDNSARVQTVDEERFPRFFRILTAFKELTGSPVVINTSFNVRGEPIVCTPQDAHRCFLGTNMDALVLGNHILLREEQPEGHQTVNSDAYLQQFSLD